MTHCRPNFAVRPVVFERRGSAYVFVLSLCLIVTVLGMGALTLTRVSARTAVAGNDWEIAGTLAFSATEHAIALLNTKAAASPSTWRTAYVSGLTAFTQTVGSGSFSWALKDETDGNLNTDVLRPFRIYGIGRSGKVTRVYSVQVLPAGGALDVLRTALHTADTMKLTGNGRAVNGPFSSNASIALSGTVNGSVEAPSISGSASGTRTTTVTAAKQMPSSSVLQTLSANATTIDYASIAGGTIQKCVLSAGVNPYGTPAANGVYLINVPNGQKLQITNCRIAATLLISCTDNSTIEIDGPVLWEPPAADLPSAVISGPGVQVKVSGNNTWLTESAAAANLNPSSTPFNGVSNATSTDDFPPQYRGVFHIIAGSNGKVKFDSNSYFTGTLIADCPVETSSQSTFVQDPNVYASPPKGYAKGDVLKLMPGTWRWDTLP